MDMPTRHAHTGQMHADPKASSNAAGLKDPVCGMSVTEQSPHHLDHDGHLYYFCSAKCQAKFDAEPARFIQAGPAAQPAAPGALEAAAGTIYTCPMHPEIRQDRPGTAPSAG